MNKPDQADMDRPFPGFPVCSRYAAIGSIEEARQRICRMLDRGEALGVVMGPPGTGKTLLCQKVASLYRHSHAIVNLGDIRVSSRLGLIQQVLFHLGKPHQGADEGSLHLALVQSLTQTVDGPRPLLLIIDEAQMLSPDLLDEVRMMTNLVRQGRPMVQTLLVGGPRLEDALADPQLESLTQRVAVRCYLHPMTQGETDQYIRTAMSVMALRVDDQAVAAVHHACGGIPRLINQLMDQAIEVARNWKKSCLDDACVQSAWSELQQLPSPVLDAELRPQGTPVEFGELDGEALDFAHQQTPVEPAVSPSEAIGGNRHGEAEGVSPEGRSGYADMASILNSTSIDCLPLSEETSQRPAEAAVKQTSPVRQKEAEAPSVPAPVPVTAQRTWSTEAPDELFGVDFDQETPLDIAWAQRPELAIDPAQAELSLHEELRHLSAAVEAATGDRYPEHPAAAQPLWAVSDGCVQAQPAAPQDPTAQPRSPQCDTPRELACPLAVVWSDEEVTALQGDDRDLLVIEEDVTMATDAPRGSFVASGALRKPTQDVDQNYQNLFSRLRGGQ